MSDNVIPLFGQKPTDPVVINEAYFESWTNEQLAYRAWYGCDLAEEILFDEESCDDSRGDARFEVLMAQYALRVLVRRLTGVAATDIREQAAMSFLARVAADLEEPQ